MFKILITLLFISSVNATQISCKDVQLATKLHMKRINKVSILSKNYRKYISYFDRFGPFDSKIESLKIITSRLFSRTNSVHQEFILKRLLLNEKANETRKSDFFGTLKLDLFKGDLYKFINNSFNNKFQKNTFLNYFKFNYNDYRLFAYSDFMSAKQLDLLFLNNQNIDLESYDKFFIKLNNILTHKLESYLSDQGKKVDYFSSSAIDNFLSELVADTPLISYSANEISVNVLLHLSELALLSIQNDIMEGVLLRQESESCN